MKKGLFTGLLFREFYVARKNYGYNLYAYLSVVVVGLLALLSYKCGNLNRYGHLMDVDTQSAINMAIKYMPAYTAAFFFGGASDAVPNDENIIWRRFRTTCPATPFRLALAKYSCLLITLLISFVLTFGWFGLYSLLTDTPITQADLGIALTVYSIAVLLIIYMLNICILVRTLERTFLICMMTVCVIIIPITLNPELMTISSFNTLTDFCVTLMPFTPFIILGTFLSGLLCTTILYGRREK